MNTVKRLALYAFYDREGFVGDYVKYYIKELKKVTDRIIFIVSGQIQPDGKKEIEGIGAEVFTRENNGFDFGAWKYTILTLGFPEILKYDDLILCSCSSYGPVYPLSGVFSEMESRNCDFWGITKHPATGALLVKGDKSSEILEHVQSYFMVFSKNVVESSGFHKWWKELHPADEYFADIASHENRFTSYLHRLGFKYDTYVNCDKYFKLLSFDHRYIKRTASFNPNNPTYSPDGGIIKIDRDPFVSRKLFLNESHIWTNTGAGFTPIDIINELKQTSYPVGLIYADLLRNQKLSAIKDSLALTWVHKKAQHYSKRRLALVCYAYYSDLAEYMCHYLLNMPQGSDLYLISSKEEVLDSYKKILDGQEGGRVFGKIYYLLKPNRGRDVASLLVTFAPYVRNYDGFCFVHDKKSKQLLYTLAHDFLRRCLECCLDSRPYVKDLVETLFDDSSKCGLMFPPTPYFSLYGTIGAESFGETSSLILSLFEKLNLTIPFDDKLMAPFGTMFWARTDALTDLFSYKWDYDDFPEEPMPVDHTISHALERIFCFCAQNRGYFSKWAMPESFAELYINNLSYRLRDFNIELNRIFRIHCWYDQLNILKSVPTAAHFSTVAPDVNHVSKGNAVRTAVLKTAAVPVNAETKPDRQQLATKTIEENTPFNFFSYLRYKLLYKITFGRRKEHYRSKYMSLKAIKEERRIWFF